jgi:hypothetical protein
MNLNLVLRRTHLYLGMLLAPWVLMYGVSSAVYNHQPFLREHFPMRQPEWTLLMDKSYQVDLPADNQQLRAAGARILQDNGLAGVAFGVYRSGATFNVFLPNFWHPRRLIYNSEQYRLRLERRQFSWSEFLTRQHGRGGYHQPTIGDNLWAFCVDLVCVALLAWVGTGLYLWWNLRATRVAGLLALCGGAGAFILFLLRL